MRDAGWLVDRPLQRLHCTEAAAHHRSETLNPQVIGQPRLRFDPVLYGDHWELRSPRSSGARIDARRSGGAVATAEIIHTHYEELAGVERFAGTHQIVPPAQILRIVGIDARDVVRSVQRMADEHGVAARRIKAAVRLIRELVAIQDRAAAQG